MGAWEGVVLAASHNPGQGRLASEADLAAPSCSPHPAAPSIQNMPVTSHICEPLKGAVIDDDEVTGAPLCPSLLIVGGVQLECCPLLAAVWFVLVSACPG